MRVRRRLQQRLFSYSLRRLKQEASPAERELLEFALNDIDVLELAYEQTMEDASAEKASGLEFTISRAEDGSPVVDNVLKLFDWFLKNGPAIIQIIKLISEMFGGLTEATVILKQSCFHCANGQCQRETKQ